MTSVKLCYRDGGEEEISVTFGEWQEIWLTGKRNGRLVEYLEAHDFTVNFLPPVETPYLDAEREWYNRVSSGIDPAGEPSFGPISG